MPTIQMYLNKMRLIGSLFLLSTSVSLTASANGIPKCYMIFKDKVKLEAAALDEMSETHKSLIQQLETRLVRFEEMLTVANPITQRKGQKIIDSLRKISERSIENREIADKDFENIMQQNEKIAELELSLADANAVQNVDPFRLRRYLFTAEAIRHSVEYYALNLKGFGQVKIEFSEQAADFFNQTGAPRDIYFPGIFKGKVGPKSFSGIKKLTAQSAYDTQGRLWELMELKQMGSEARVMVLFTEGYLFFYRVIKNHKRVEYVSKENIIGDFFKLKNLEKETPKPQAEVE